MLCLLAWGSAAPALAQGSAGAERHPVADTLPEPWRLDRARGLPEWLELRVEQQARYESLDEDFRAGQDGSNQLWSLRHLIRSTLSFGDWRVVGEFADVRAFDLPSDPDKFISQDIVDAADLLQAYLGYGARDLFAPGDRLDLRLGRQCLDLGSRRLVARNVYRPTVNAFGGLGSTWRSGRGAQVDVFAVSPVERLPGNDDPQALRDNELEFDQERTETLFAGVHAVWPVLGDAASAELYSYGLFEHDEPGLATRDRELVNLGARLSRPPGPRAFGFDTEAVLQVGESRVTAVPGDPDLEHRAWYAHASLQYRLAGSGAPTLGLLFDWGSGDDDPTDGENGRFDFLFGARVPLFGPTSLYGPFGFNNVVSPGVRLEVAPTERLSLRLTHRLYWLDSERDALPFAGVQDPSGASGSFAGQGTDLRLRYDLAPRNLQLEVGLSHLAAGRFLEDAPGTVGPQDTTYVYFMSTLTF